MQEKTAAIVGILDLQVFLVQEGDCWIAQAVELDYASYGATEAEARANFENGLRDTIQDHFDEFGDLDNLFRQAPPELWRDLVDKSGAKENRFYQVSVHPLDLPIPFGAIKYLGQSERAA